MATRSVLFALAGLSFVALVVLAVLVRARLRPRIPHVGLSEGRLRSCPSSSNCVVTEGGDSAHSAAPIVFRGAPAVAMHDLTELLARRPRVRIVTARPDYVHAEFRSALFGFVDDFEARLDEKERRIEVRSASRSGTSDLGVNRRRVESIRAALEKP